MGAQIHPGSVPGPSRSPGGASRKFPVFFSSLALEIHFFFHRLAPEIPIVFQAPSLTKLGFLASSIPPRCSIIKGCKKGGGNEEFVQQLRNEIIWHGSDPALGGAGAKTGPIPGNFRWPCPKLGQILGISRGPGAGFGSHGRKNSLDLGVLQRVGKKSD